MTHEWMGLAGWLLATMSAAVVGALSTRNAREFYGRLNKPRWAPPGWLFGPVWTVLYLMMAVASWLVWRRAGWGGAPTALALFVAQLVFNAAWSWVFFSWRRGGLATVTIVLLLGLIVATLATFAPIHLGAAGLMVPYLAWVAFASALTYSVWRGNPGQLGA